MLKTFEVNPGQNLFSADSVSEIIASENLVDFNFEKRDFPLTLKRLDFSADTQFSTTMRITFKCTKSAYNNRYAGKEFSIPFYASKYLYDAESGNTIVDDFIQKESNETAMSFAEEITIEAHKPAEPASGPAPKNGKMYVYSRMKGYAEYLEGKERKDAFYTLRKAILDSGVVEGQEKNYIRDLACSKPLVSFFEPEIE